MSRCEKCNDRKYIIVNGKWQDCLCLLQLKLRRKYELANIPKIFQEYGWSDFFKDFPRTKRLRTLCKKILRKVKRNKKCKFLYITGDTNSGKQAFVSLLLKEFIVLNLTCKFVSLSDLIQMEFSKEEKDEKIFNYYDIVCLRMGTVIEHKYARFVLEKFYTSRRNNRKYCIITSRIDISTKSNIYGLEMSKLVNDGRKFLKVRMR